MNIEIGLLISLIGVALSIGTFFVGRTSAAKASGKESGTMMTEIGYIKANTDEIKAEQKEQRKFNTDFTARLTAVEESTKSAHKRLDTIEKGGKSV